MNKIVNELNYHTLILSWSIQKVRNRINSCPFELVRCIYLQIDTGSKLEIMEPSVHCGIFLVTMTFKCLLLSNFVYQCVDYVLFNMNERTGDSQNEMTACITIFTSCL